MTGEVRFVTLPGWVGHWIEGSVAGAYPNGARVRKVYSDPGDAHPIGAMATVLSSVTHPDEGIAYFVEWDLSPRRAVLVVAKKLAKAG